VILAICNIEDKHLRLFQQSHASSELGPISLRAAIKSLALPTALVQLDPRAWIVTNASFEESNWKKVLCEDDEFWRSLHTSPFSKQKELVLETADSYLELKITLGPPWPEHHALVQVLDRTQENNFHKSHEEFEVLLEVRNQENLRKDQAIAEMASLLHLQIKTLTNHLSQQLESTALPILKRLKKINRDASIRKWLEALEASLQPLLTNESENLGEITEIYPSSFSIKEIRVCEWIRQERTTKEIAELLNLSVPTIEFHRRNIRNKLGLTRKGDRLEPALRQLFQNSNKSS